MTRKYYRLVDFCNGASVCKVDFGPGALKTIIAAAREYDDGCEGEWVPRLRLVTIEDVDFKY